MIYTLEISGSSSYIYDSTYKINMNDVIVYYHNSKRSCLINLLEVLNS
jgi:hypothetical protein